MRRAVRSEFEPDDREFSAALAEKLAKQRKRLRRNLEASLRNAGREGDLESASCLRKRLESMSEHLPELEEVRRSGRIANDLDWENGATVSVAYIRVICGSPYWKRLLNSYHRHNGVYGQETWSSMTVNKYYSGVFKLVRCEGELFWIRS